MLMLEKSPTLFCVWDSLNEVEAILERFEFFEYLQIIVNRNKIFWCLTMPKKELFQIPYHLFVYVTCNQISPSCTCDISRYVEV